MADAWPYLVSGVVFGLVAGLSPGPMLALVISETLRQGRRAGMLVALAPLFSDAPIVALSVFLLTQLAQSDAVLGVISLVGAAFVAYLAYESLRVTGLRVAVESPASRSLLKGVVLNFLNPHPYLFWIAVGAPTVLAASERGLAPPAVFLVSFYALLVGSKVTVALLVDRSRGFLTSRGYVWVVRGLGVVLVVFALLFVREGVTRLMATAPAAPEQSLRVSPAVKLA